MYAWIPWEFPATSCHFCILNRGSSSHEIGHMIFKTRRANKSKEIGYGTNVNSSEWIWAWAWAGRKYYYAKFISGIHTCIYFQWIRMLGRVLNYLYVFWFLNNFFPLSSNTFSWCLPFFHSFANGYGEWHSFDDKRSENLKEEFHFKHFLFFSFLFFSFHSFPFFAFILFIRRFDSIKDRFSRISWASAKVNSGDDFEHNRTVQP